MLICLLNADVQPEVRIFFSSLLVLPQPASYSIKAHRGLNNVIPVHSAESCTSVGLADQTCADAAPMYVHHCGSASLDNVK